MEASRVQAGTGDWPGVGPHHRDVATCSRIKYANITLHVIIYVLHQ